MSNVHISAFARELIQWIQFVERNRLSVIFSIIILAIASIFYIKDNLGMSTSTTDMLSEDLHWRKLDAVYEKLFPQFNDNILVVIEADTPDRARDSAQTLYSRLQNETKFLNDVYYPSVLPYFRESAFLFLELEELQDLSDRLAMIQPFLGTLLEDQNLRGLFSMLNDAIQAKQDGENVDIKPLLLEINRALENKDYQVSWQRLMNPEDEAESVYREFIMLQTKDNSESALPDEDIIEHVRAVITSVIPAGDSSIKTRLTGGTVLSYEELKSVSKANIQAIALSFFLVAIILLIGLGSLWLVSACLITLFFGLIVTTALATATVGELNLISVAFAVLYIGLGIDFAIHTALRFREEKLKKLDNDHALKNAITRIFKSLILCAITTAIGFYSFIPTDYRGVAELGWIAGSGMFISFIFTFTLLPALLSFFSYKQATSTQGRLPRSVAKILMNMPYQHTKLILLITFIIVTGLATQIDKISFDTNTLNLQDPANESVQTYRDLLEDSKTSPWQGVLLKKDLANAEKTQQDIKALSLVDDVIWLNKLIPEEQEDKLFIIDDMNLLLGSLDTAASPTDINNEARTNAIKALHDKLAILPVDKLDDDIKQLKSNLDKLLPMLDDNGDTQYLSQLEQQLLNSFSGRVRSLADALNAEEVSLENIPAEVQQRWSSNDYYKMQILPTHNLNDNTAMKNFVRQLQAYDADVIGSPIIRIEAGEAVITAFKSAFSYAFIAIAILLFLLIKVKTDAIVILISVMVGGFFTFGFMLLFDIPLNFANIIGLPLLLGIGVDSGIHIADRFRQEHTSGKNIFMTSASRGVFVSSLTTICSIGNLAFSTHQGTASMGLLLSLGLVSMMVSTMIILPAFLIWLDSLAGEPVKRA